MGRSIPDLLWTVSSKAQSYADGQSISFTAVPEYGTWGSMSFIMGISQTTAGSATIYNPTVTVRDWKSFYDNVGVVTKIAQSGPESAAAKTTWSTIIYPVFNLGSTTSAPSARTKLYAYVAVSYAAKTPAGIYKFRIDVTGTYSNTDHTQANYYETYSYIYADRERTQALTGWQKKTAHQVFRGGEASWEYEPWGYKSGQSTTTKTSQIISFATDVLGGVSRTEVPDKRRR